MYGLSIYKLGVSKHALSKLFGLCMGLLCLLASNLIVAVPLTINKVKLTVDLATPVMEAGKQQNAFVKIALTGFPLGQDKSQRTPANIAIVLDKSGSMNGEKIQQAKEAAILAIQKLNSQDVVSIVTYDSRVNVVVPATKVSDKVSIAEKIRHIRASGNTALFAGVSKGAFEVRKFISDNKVNRVILLSDGLANVGPSSADALGELGRSLGKEGISVTTIGLGLGYNEDLMTQLAGFSDGNHAFVENAEDLVRIFQYEFGDVLSVVAQGVDIEIECADGIKPLRIIGRDGEVMGNRVRTHMNQLYSEQEKYIILEVQIPVQKAGNRLDLVKVNVSYNNLALKKTQKVAGVAKASFSASEQKVKKAINKKAYEDSVVQVANEAGKKAIKLRDKGDVTGAQSVLKDSASFLGSSAVLLSSPKLQEQKAEALSDAEELAAPKWNKKRKALKERQYKRSVQQTY